MTDQRDYFGNPCPHGIFHEEGIYETVCKVCHEDILSWHDATFIHPCDVGVQIADAVYAERARIAEILENLPARLLRSGKHPGDIAIYCEILKTAMEES